MDHRYIARKRARFTAICGPVNIPYGTAVGVRDGLLSLGPDQPLCDPASKNGEDYFCADDDNLGQERAGYINAILAALQKRDEQYQARWDKIWSFPLCAQYRRPDIEDRWLWGHAFYCAPIDHLRQIAEQIGVTPTRG